MIVLGVAAGVVLLSVPSQTSTSSASSSSSCASQSFSPSNLVPVDVISVIGPIPPYNPGGPEVSIVLKNVGETPITFLNATLTFTAFESVAGAVPTSYSFIFGASASSPLQPGQSLSEERTLMDGGFSTGDSYPLAICGTLAGGPSFSYTVQVQIVPPS